MTTFYKIIGVIWICGFGVGTLAILTSSSKAMPFHLKWLFPLLWILVSPVWLWMFRMKKVMMEADFLVISGFSDTVRVPLSQVNRVREFQWTNPRMITLSFSVHTDLGDSITFIPASRSFLLWQEHPIAHELRELTGLTIKNEIV
jgi:hypothetical protein